MALRSANPALTANTFSGVAQRADLAELMTIQGTVNKTALLLVIVVVAAAPPWILSVRTGDLTPAIIALLGGLFGGLVFAIITVVKKSWAPVTAPLYALFEGACLGAISMIFELQYPGIVAQAVALTFGTLFALLMAYRSGLIRATENFKLGVTAATGGIFLIYATTFVLGLFGIRVPYIHESGLIGIGFSLFVVVIAALNLVLDFDFIENGAKLGAPKYMEWYGAFGLIVTLVWLYLEILDLLAKIRSRKE